MKKQIFIIFTLFAMAYMGILSLRPLVSPDETRYAQISSEMIDSGDWVVPRLDGFKYFEKPVLGYWLNSISMQVFGKNNFAIRFMAAIATLLTGLIIFFTVRTFYDDRSAFTATLIYLFSTGVYIIGTTAILDSILNAFLTATAVSLFFVIHSNSMWKKYLFILSVGIFLGAAFLTKGFLAFAVIGGTIIGYLCWEFARYVRFTKNNNSTPPPPSFNSEMELDEKKKNIFLSLKQITLKKIILQTLLLSAIFTIAISFVVLPWAMEIYHKAPDFWRYFVVEEHFRRFLSKKAQHSEPFFYYLLILPLLFLPWTLMLPIFSFDFKKSMCVFKTNPLLRYSLCWFVLPLVFFSFSKGKLPTYILPCIPPLTIIFLAMLKSTHPTSSQKSITPNRKEEEIEIPEINNTAPPDKKYGMKIFNYLTKTLFLIFIIGTFIFITAQYYGIPMKNGKFFIFDNSFEKTKIYSVLLSLFMIILSLYKLPSFKDFHKKILTLSIIAALVYINLMASIPSVMIKNSKKAPGNFISSFKSKITPLTVIASDHTLMASVCWFTKRKDIFIVLSPGEIEYSINKNMKNRFLKNKTQFENFLKKNKNNDVLLFMTTKHYRKNILKRDLLPRPKKAVVQGRLTALFYQ